MVPRHPSRAATALRPGFLPALLALLGLVACTPYYADLPAHEKRTLERAREAKAEGDAAGSCAMLAGAAAGAAHPSVLIAHARCLMDGGLGPPDLEQARAVLERAYALPSPRRGRAALWLAALERRSGASAQAQIAWLERAQALGEPGTERLLVKAWAQEPQRYRVELIDAYRRGAATDPYAALELARMLAADPATEPTVLRAQTRAALRALEAGARAGNATQARTLAWLYRAGELVPADSERARRWLTLAAQGEDPKALRQLAEQAQAAGDAAAAQRWLERAVAAGDAKAAASLSRGLLAGRYRAEDPAAAEALIARTAGSGAFPEVTLAYGEALLEGGLGRRDPQAGVALIGQAAAAGHLPAQVELGRRLLRGEDVPADAARGQALLEAAADAGDAGAMFHLARAWLYGQGVGRDPGLGMDWLRRSADAGSRGARLELARRMLTGQDVPVDTAQGRAMLEDLAEAGDVRAMQALAQAYAAGTGLPRNPAARRWLSRAEQASRNGGA